MKRILFLLALVCLDKALYAQTPHTPYVYTIKADSVKITSTCDTAELIVENHTQTVPGFLFNKGRGRTEFRKAMTKVDDSIYTIGIDTLRLSVAWLQGGNKFGSTGKFGTLDNNHIDFYTNNTKQGRWANTGNLLLGTEADNGAYKLAVEGTTYSKFFTNIPTATAFDMGGGAIRLRWGTPASGEYISFHYQDQAKRRGGISTGADGRPLVITDDIGITFFKTPFVAVGQEWGAGDNSYTNSRLTVSSLRSSGWNAFTIRGLTNPADDSPGEVDFKVTGIGNTIVGGPTDNGHKLQVNGTTYSQIFTNVPEHLGAGDEGPIRLRYSSGGDYVSFYFQDRNKRRGFIGAGSNDRPLRIYDSVGISLMDAPYLSIGTEFPHNASLSVTTPQNSMLDVFNASTDNGSYRSCLTVKKSGNTVLGDNLFDIGSRLQVIGSVYIKDTLKMPNIISKTESSAYSPMVVDANGNVFKLAGSNSAQLNRTAVNDAGYSALSTDYLIAYTAITAPRTVTLPAASGMLNHIYIIKDESGAAATNNITVNVTAGGLIDGASSKAISANYGLIEVYSNGSQWFTK